MSPRLSGRVRGQLTAYGGYMRDLKRERCRGIGVGSFPRGMGQRSSLEAKDSVDGERQLSGEGSL